MTTPLTGRDLEIAIAKARGYYVVQSDVKHFPYSLWYNVDSPIKVYNSDGDNEDEAWDCCPRYLSDANAVRELMVEIVNAPTTRFHAAGRVGLLGYFLDGNYEAICRWWLELQSKDES